MALLPRQITGLIGIKDVGRILKRTTRKRCGQQPEKITDDEGPDTKDNSSPPADGQTGPVQSGRRLFANYGYTLRGCLRLQQRAEIKKAFLL